jgi:hypothetical protein
LPFVAGPAVPLFLAWAVPLRQSGGHSGEQPGGQDGSSQQHPAPQSGGQTSEQPAAQLASRQQSTAFVVLRALASANPAHTPLTIRSVSVTAAPAVIHVRLVIGGISFRATQPPQVGPAYPPFTIGPLERSEEMKKVACFQPFPSFLPNALSPNYSNPAP